MKFIEVQSFGVTATRNGATRNQLQSFVKLMAFIPNAADFRHGACVGGDEQATALVAALRPSVFITAHPGKSAPPFPEHPELVSKPALDLSHRIEEPETHFARNRRYASLVNLMIGMPFQSEAPVPRKGGTWFTIEYKQKLDGHAVIIWPSGLVTCHGHILNVDAWPPDMQAFSPALSPPPPSV